jgi:hypothetical protein
MESKEPSQSPGAGSLLPALAQHTPRAIREQPRSHPRPRPRCCCCFMLFCSCGVAVV